MALQAARQNEEQILTNLTTLKTTSSPYTPAKILDASPMAHGMIAGDSQGVRARSLGDGPHTLLVGCVVLCGMRRSGINCGALFAED